MARNAEGTKGCYTAQELLKSAFIHTGMFWFLHRIIYKEYIHKCYKFYWLINLFQFFWFLPIFTNSVLNKINLLLHEIKNFIFILFSWKIISKSSLFDSYLIRDSSLSHFEIFLFKQMNIRHWSKFLHVMNTQQSIFWKKYHLFSTNKHNTIIFLI